MRGQSKLLGAAAAALMVGALDVATVDTGLAAMYVSTGFIMVGAWLVSMFIDWEDDDKDDRRGEQ